MSYADDEIVLASTDKVGTLKDSVTGRHFERVVLCAIDSGGALIPLVGEDLGSGAGVLVSAIGKQEVTGAAAVGDDLTGALPVFLGAYACTSLQSPTPLTDNKLQTLKTTADGVLLARPYANPESTISATASNTDGSSTQVIAAQATGVKTYLTWVHLVNTSATPIYVEMKDGTTVRDTIYVKATDWANVEYYGCPLKGTAATAWNFDPSAAATTVICTVGGYLSKV